MKAAIYARVSTGEQSVDAQVAELRELAGELGHQVVEVYTETESGAAKRRPVLERAMADARGRRFRVLFVWALDRLGRRSMLEQVRTVLELERMGVEIHSKAEPWLNTSADNPVRDLLLSIFSWVAAQERRRLSERTKAGLAQARRKGKRLGRPTKGLDPHKVAWVAKANSLDFAAKAFGVSRTTIKTLIRTARLAAAAGPGATNGVRKG